MLLERYSSLCVPSPTEAGSLEEYLELVQRAMKEQTGELISLEELEELWNLADMAICNQGDIFWDADEYEQCYYCHLYDEGNCPNSSDNGNPIDPKRCNVWYGSSPSERMLTLATPAVLRALLAVRVGYEKSSTTTS